jgi:hypothetical protein
VQCAQLHRVQRGRSVRLLQTQRHLRLHVGARRVLPLK